MFTVAASIVLLMVAIMFDSDHFKFIVKPEYQVIAGTFVIAIILFDNALAGLMCGLAIIIMYTRVIGRKYGINLDIMTLFETTNKTNPLKPGNPMRKLVKETPYISPANLLDAQNNIVDSKSYNDSYVGIPKINGFSVYSAEGTTKEGETQVLGYDNEIYIGSSVKR